MAVVLVDDYSPRYVGDLSPALQHQFVDHSGKVFPLAGVNASNMTFVLFCPDTGQRKVGGGTWAITDPTNGIAVYSWAALDVADAGLWQMQAGVPFGGLVQHFDIKEIQFILPL